MLHNNVREATTKINRRPEQLMKQIKQSTEIPVLLLFYKPQAATGKFPLMSRVNIGCFSMYLSGCLVFHYELSYSVRYTV